MGYVNVDAMLDGMESWQLAEWQAYEAWEEEMETRRRLQRTANAKVEELRRKR